MTNILDPVRNFVEVSVSIGYDNSATSIALVTGEGAKLPVPSSEGDFNLVWYNATDYNDPSLDPNREIVRVTAVGTDTLTITRAQEGTSASTKNTAGKAYRMLLTPTKKLRDDIETNITKAAGSDITTGTDNVKVVTAKALADAGFILDTDGTLAANSDTKIPSQKAVKTYADTKTTLTAVQQDVTTNYGMARQAIMNGNFDIWQRGTSLSLGTITAYLADRWLCSVGDISGALTVSRQSFTIGQSVVPNNPKYFLRFAENGTPGVAPYVTQRIEGVEHFANGKATLSIWLSVGSGTLVVTPRFIQSFGSGGSPSSDVITTNSTWTVTTTPTKFTTTFTIPSISGKTLGSTVGTDYCAIKLDFPTGGSFTIDIAQVQLCAGDVALPFQPKSFEEELRTCQRYYEKSYDYATAIGTNTQAGASLFYSSLSAGNWTAASLFHTFKVRKRIIPTVHVYSSSTGTIDKIYDINGTTDRTATYDGAGENSFRTYCTPALTTSVNIQSHWTADAEL